MICGVAGRCLYNEADIVRNSANQETVGEITNKQSLAKAGLFIIYANALKSIKFHIVLHKYINYITSG
ncbi:MAG TPA: hypothetical protein DEH24_17285 [Alteromonas sp.]|nr:hypothetical protein [Alteromonadaceae bacterium]MAX42190.1 hypothetical protein [Alteromonadaceae bacterium]HBY41184.1 hypothetical protein [Alteromonas sp.]